MPRRARFPAHVGCIINECCLCHCHCHCHCYCQVVTLGGCSKRCTSLHPRTPLRASVCCGPCCPWMPWKRPTVPTRIDFATPEVATLSRVLACWCVHVIEVVRGYPHCAFDSTVGSIINECCHCHCQSSPKAKYSSDTRAAAENCDRQVCCFRPAAAKQRCRQVPMCQVVQRAAINVAA